MGGRGRETTNYKREKNREGLRVRNMSTDTERVRVKEIQRYKERIQRDKG